MVAAQFRNKGTHFYHFDKNGSTAALTDELGKLYRPTQAIHATPQAFAAALNTVRPTAVGVGVVS